MKYSTTEKLLRSQSRPSTRMILKLSALTLLIISCYTMVSTHFSVGKVSIPDGCANACPPQRDASRFICGRNRVTGVLGMFDGECFFGRYNHCIHVRQPYEFIRYGHCKSGDF